MNSYEPEDKGEPFENEMTQKKNKRKKNISVPPYINGSYVFADLVKKDRNVY